MGIPRNPDTHFSLKADSQSSDFGQDLLLLPDRDRMHSLNSFTASRGQDLFLFILGRFGRFFYNIVKQVHISVLSLLTIVKQVVFHTIDVNKLLHPTRWYKGADMHDKKVEKRGQIGF
jgi:hypothetical protein